MEETRVYGLIGYPLTHSFSEKYFLNKFHSEKIENCTYKNFEIASIDEIKSILQIPELNGLNVTIPYKEKIVPFLDQISEEASEAGAVNTIRVRREKEHIFLEGFNTDIFGFSMSLKPFLLNIHERALILGTGGASKAVQFVLKKLGIEFRLVSRNMIKNGFSYDELNEYILRSHLLIINTTPVGMHPDIENSPQIPWEFITHQHLLYDLIYNPEETLFLKKGKEKGAVTLNGSTMLRLQAEKSWQIWNEK